MHQKPASFLKSIVPLLVVFVVVNILLLFLHHFMNTHQINAWVVFTANDLLFIVSLLSLFLHIQSTQKKSAMRSVNNVMLASVIKLLVLGGAAILYLIASGSNRSIYAILVGLVLYIIYTAIEVSIATKINGKK